MISATARQPPIGPINSGEVVSLVVKYNNLYYVATYDSLRDDILFLWYFSDLGVVNPTLNNNTIMQFRVSGNYDHLILDVTNTRASGRRVLSKLSGTTRVMSVIPPSSADDSIAVVTEYSAPPSPGVLFASANYAPTVAGVGSSISIVGQQTSVGTPFIANADIYPIPTVFYLRSEGDTSTFTCSTSMSDASLGIRTFICQSCSGSGCGGVQYCTNPSTSIAWTRITDCQVDNLYAYCKKGQTCGQCYGQCGGGHQECRHATGSRFVCSNQTPIINSELITLNPSGAFQPFLPGGQVNEDDLFIVPYNYTPPGSDTVAIVIICIVVLIIIIGIAVYIYESRQTPTPASVGYDYPQSRAYSVGNY